MSGGRRVALVVAGVTLGAAVLVAVLAAVLVARGDRLLALAGRDLGRAVTAERVGLSLRGGPGVALSGVRIADDPAFAAEPFVTAGRVEMRARVGDLLRRRVVIDRVVLRDPVITVVRARDGKMNVESLGARRPRAKGPPPAAKAATAGRRPRAFQLATLQLRRGAIRYLDQGSGRHVDLVDVTVDAREPTLGAPVPITVRGRLSGKDVHVEGLASEGVLDPLGPAFHGTVGAGPGAFGPLALARLDAEMVWTAPASSGSFTLSDGRVEGLRVGATVLDVLRPFLRSGEADRFRERYPDLFGEEGVHFTRLAGSARTAGERIQLTDLVVEAPSYELRGHGSLVPDGDIDLALRLLASRSLTDDLLGRSSARQELVDGGGRLAIPLAIRGPARRPHVSTTPEFTAAVARQILGGSKLEEAASSLLDRLFKRHRRER